MSVNKINSVLLILFSLLLFVLIFVQAVPVEAASYDNPVVSIGDISNIKGARVNQLYGYGLVIGLPGTGDTSRYQPTIESHANMLNNMGIEVDSYDVMSENVASVMVTAELPAFMHSGQTIDITVSSLGDAESLEGGTLFMTPLRAANGEIYAAAQGRLLIQNYEEEQQGMGMGQSSGVPTTLTIPNGAIVEKELSFSLDNRKLTYILENPNFETARNISLAVNQNFRFLFPEENIARALNSNTVEINVPEIYRDDVVDFIAQINVLDVRPGLDARVSIDANSGTIVMGNNVRISTVAVSTGNISVTINNNAQNEQHTVDNDNNDPWNNDDSWGDFVGPGVETNINEDENGGSSVVLSGRGTVSDLVDALNSVGATPTDIINILRQIKNAGALHAELLIN